MSGMTIQVRRILETEEETLSDVTLIKEGGGLNNGDVRLCFGLEDQKQPIKVPGETRIPKGMYKVKLRKEGGMHARYAERFAFHEGMLHLQDVPGFTYIYIHIGNTDDHTAGCILVGQEAVRQEHGSITLANSALAYRRLYTRVIPYARTGELYVSVC